MNFSDAKFFQFYHNQLQELHDLNPHYFVYNAYPSKLLL